MITAAVDHVPPPLLAQLKEGGRMVMPLGNPYSVQSLVVGDPLGRRPTGSSTCSGCCSCP